MLALQGDVPLASRAPPYRHTASCGKDGRALGHFWYSRTLRLTQGLA
jgi:hypothetical protein